MLWWDASNENPKSLFSWRNRKNKQTTNTFWLQKYLIWSCEMPIHCILLFFRKKLKKNQNKKKTKTLSGNLVVCSFTNFYYSLDDKLTICFIIFPQKICFDISCKLSLFPENRLTFYANCLDNLHDMSKPTFWEKYEKYFKVSFFPAC